ncbi:MAG TPA: penicillin-binding transpeptidase domain-containing protein [Kiritimatiellia bacterium]|nr:penicillin-binding transpeptidase domain-containing protein [Kiritimatiellia bacterium]
MIAEWLSREWSPPSWIPMETLAVDLPFWRSVFWMLSAIALLSFFLSSRKKKQGAFSSASNRRLMVVIGVLFVGILIYQATWQLAGFSRPEFVQFMKKYNRRPDNPVARIVRGEVLDARGNVLAKSDPERLGQRWYPYGAAFCHVVGYDHPFYGMSGIEAADHASLSGVTRDSVTEWERFGKNLINRDDIRGNNLQLTLLAQLQVVAHEAMMGKKGAAVFIDAQTGHILVLYSAPGFDPEYMPSGMFEREDRDAKFLNRVLQGLYPAGSTLKVLVAAAALEHGKNPTFACPADGVVFGTGNRPIRDHEYYDYQRRGRSWPGHGTLNMREALAKSSNIYFARLGVDLGGDILTEVANRCGLNSAWMVFHGSSGSISSRKGRFNALKREDRAKTAQVSIGQGDMLVTPFHMAMMAAAIGNQGSPPKPILAVAEKSQKLPAFFDVSASKKLTEMMRYAVTSGTGRGADIPGLNVAGKTGTAQNPHGKDHGWFIGFAPDHQPRIAFAVVVEQGGYGSESAVPVANAVLRKAREIGVFDQVSSMERRTSL